MNVVINVVRRRRAFTSQLAWLVVLLVTIGCYGCAANKRTVDPSVALAEVESRYEVPANYVIQPGDQLDVKFFYTPEFNESVVVRPDGKVSLQLVDDVQAAGLIPAQLDEFLTNAYASELRDPAVTVLVRTITEPRVYLAGDVAKPGFITVRNKIGVLQAIDEAGGFLDTANLSDVSVIRKGPDNQPMAHEVDVEEILDGSLSDSEFLLEPADVVYVPKRGIAKAANFMDQIRKIIMINGLFIPLF
ncbi:polysaccharide biosynthesis/export family protein [Methylocaldum sp.]|uniref:polysaccharide biosynthesis/export family protein n=1 Tax=Methylocaldum sp. TaxID=1969727 RepID=UPI002D6ED502|nr:polysaccharide biosynthesis/export family protein [Methylocaldum sp.]HYE35593.1 polysaccharide biosynthesis/export family protein [Methylocaldum sp.]